MRELVVDVRKMLDSGIGVYVRNVVPRVLDRLPDCRVTLLGQRDALQAQQDCLSTENAQWVSVGAGPFSAAEQWELRTLLKPSQTLWATSLAHPLFTDRPLIATVHDVAQLALPRAGMRSSAVHAVARQYFRSLRARASLFLCVSEFTRSEFQRHVGFRPDANVVVTPLGVDPSWFEASSCSRPSELPSRYFVVVGNLRPHKNLRRVLEAFSRVALEIPHHLVIIGKHEGFRTGDAGLVDLIRSLVPRVHFLGSLGDSELKGIVASADALIFASLYEGFGLPAVEAAAAGTLVLASRTGGIPDVCGESGLFVDPESVDSIGDGMIQVARMTNEERSRRIEMARSRALHFSWERTADQTAAAIDSALRPPPQ